MWKRTPHKIMGAFSGMFYDGPNDQRLYLAHRKRREIHRLRHAWLINVSTLEKCRAEGYTVVGVRWRDKGKGYTHLTLLEDFFGPDSFFHFGDTKQRGLPLKCFRIDPSKSEKVIAAAVKLR
jgi:hypothetical protein